MFSFICAWINGWVNNRDAGDLRRHRAHYDVTVIVFNDYDFLLATVCPCTLLIFDTVIDTTVNMDITVLHW